MKLQVTEDTDCVWCAVADSPLYPPPVGKLKENVEVSPFSKVRVFPDIDAVTKASADEAEAAINTSKVLPSPFSNVIVEPAAEAVTNKEPVSAEPPPPAFKA